MAGARCDTKGMTKPQVPAAHNVLRILTLLSTTDAPISATRIQRELNLPRSTTYHLLNELETSGFVVRLAKPATYGLGLAAYRMAQAYTTQQPLVRAASKDMEQIAKLAGGSSHLSRLAGSEIVYLQEMRAPTATSLVTEVGVRLSALTTASGRAMLAHLPETELRAVFDASGEHQRYRDLKQHIDTVREQGWAAEHEEVSRGQESLAVAVVDHLGRPAAALAVTFPLGKSEEHMQLLIDALRDAASHLSQRFFGNP